MVADGGDSWCVSPIVNSRVASVTTHRTPESAAILGLNMFTSIPAPHEDHIRSLIEANQQLWEDLVNHPFPRQMARGTAPLNGFRHYMIVSWSIPIFPRSSQPDLQQDVTYLKHYARLRMLSIASSRSGASFEDLENFAGKISNSIQYATRIRNVCEKQLGIPQDVVAAEPESQQLKNSITLYERVAREGDWLEYVPLRISALGLGQLTSAALFKVCTSYFYRVSW